MPAARSLYETALSAEMTGWMTVALMMLKKSVVAYKAPSTFIRGGAWGRGGGEQGEGWWGEGWRGDKGGGRIKVTSKLRWVHHV